MPSAPWLPAGAGGVSRFRYPAVMDRPTPWLPVALIMFALTAASMFLGTRPGQQGWMTLTWFALSVAVFCLAAWADERWPGSSAEPPDGAESG
jgi:hypothetical protein